MSIAATYLATIYGTLLWMVVSLVFAKDKHDDAGQKFSFKKYASKTWDNWAMAIVAIPLVAHWGPDLTALAMPDLTWSDIGYGLSGFVTQAAYYGLKKIWK